MDATTLRRIVEIQIEQGELLRQLVHAEATRQMDQHVYILHGGRNLRSESNRERDRIVAALDRNQEKLQEFVTELCKPPAPATV